MCAVERTESRGGRHPTALSGYFLKASSAFSLASWGLEFSSRLPSATEDAGVQSLFVVALRQASSQDSRDFTGVPGVEGSHHAFLFSVHPVVPNQTPSVLGILLDAGLMV